MPELMRRAFYHLRTGKGGPVLLEVPLDVWTSKCEGNLNYRLVKGSRSGPDPQEVKDVTGVLVNATNLVIHPGQGVMYAEACGELEQLAELAPRLR